MDANKEVSLNDGRKVIKLSRKNFVIGIVAIVVFVAVSFVLLLGGVFSNLLSFIIPTLVLIAIVFLIWGIIAYFITIDIALRVKARKKIISSIIFLIAVIALWGIVRLMTNSFGVGPETLNSNAIPMVPTMDEGSRSGGAEFFSVNSSRSKLSDYMPSSKYGNNQASISDTREFLKTDYNASIQTRDVNKVVRFVENAIKGADGRVDNISSSEKYGNIKFVVAKSEFEDFRSEVEVLVHAKLYTENISSENLLTQKQGIEEDQGNIVNSLENWTAQRDALVIKHNLTVANINKDLTRISKELVSIRANMKTEKDSILLASLYNQEATLMSQETIQKKNLASENSNYSIQKQNLDNLINNENNNLTNINKIDSQFMDNVETVNGYVVVRWINLWEMAKIFSPIHPIFVIIIVLIILWASFRKSKFVPKVVLE
jgi:hypothetical protein